MLYFGLMTVYTQHKYANGLLKHLLPVSEFCRYQERGGRLVAIETGCALQ